MPAHTKRNVHSLRFALCRAFPNSLLFGFRLPQPLVVTVAMCGCNFFLSQGCVPNVITSQRIAATSHTRHKQFRSWQMDWMMICDPSIIFCICNAQSMLKQPRPAMLLCHQTAHIDGSTQTQTSQNHVKAKHLPPPPSLQHSPIQPTGE